jgi:hypothetical protein
MKILRIMHIGDVHFPDAQKETQADIKDLAFPSVVTNAMLVHPLQSVIRAATIELKRTTVHGIVFSGDLTSRGDIDGYMACIDYLSNALNLPRWKANHLSTPLIASTPHWRSKVLALRMDRPSAAIAEGRPPRNVDFAGPFASARRWIVAKNVANVSSRFK